MWMFLPAETVAHHLDHQRVWFQPHEAHMTARAMDDQSYVLTLGQFRNFCFEIELTNALRLLTQKNNI